MLWEIGWTCTCVTITHLLRKVECCGWITKSIDLVYVRNVWCSWAGPNILLFVLQVTDGVFLEVPFRSLYIC